MVSCCSYLLQVQANNNIYWDAVMRDLAVIETEFGKSFSQDACKVSAMRCFLLEMDVIWYESTLGDDKSFATHVFKVIQNIDAGLGFAKDTCKLQCEMFEEKNITQFIEGLKHAVQRFHRSPQKRKS
ncbi:hypothetical protein lerEdw1_012258 [Lerista edwardsae]|nr:hypothetical protein lerEdw1_012258 [Lerista edwardsae]